MTYHLKILSVLIGVILFILGAYMLFETEIYISTSSDAKGVRCPQRLQRAIPATCIPKIGASFPYPCTILLCPEEDNK
jgi:hypothetical protein